MAPRSRTQAKRRIESYDHRDRERFNDSPVGSVTQVADRDADMNSYAYDPELDPQLQWAVKAWHNAFEVPTVSLNAHERQDPFTIMEAVRKRNCGTGLVQGSRSELPEEHPLVREAMEFYWP